MNGRYWILKYVEDLARMEPRNVGLLVLTDFGLSCRFLGEREGGILDLRSVRGVVSHTGTYKQWVEYWRDAIKESKTPSEALEKVLDSLRGNYISSEATTVSLPEATSPNEAISFLYHSLVTDFPTPRVEELNLTSRVDEILREYRLRESPYFVESPVVACPIETGLVEHVRPNFAWKNGKDVYFQKVAINAFKIESAQKEVHNAAWIFERLKSAAPQAQTKALVKLIGAGADEAEKQAREYVELLERRASEVVNVDDDSHVHKVFAPLAAGE